MESKQYYLEQYNTLILFRQNNILQKLSPGSVELHHIIPKSMGGTNDAKNLVYLTVQEHVKAHFLLWKIYDNGKMAQAYWLMVNSHGQQLSSMEVEELRKKQAEEASKRKLTEEQKHRCSVIAKERFKNKMNHPMFGKPRPQKTKDKISLANSNPSEETRKRMSNSQRKRFQDKRNHPMFGRKLSNDTRKRISDVQKKRCQTEQGRKHIMDMTLNRPPISDETRVKIGLQSKNPSSRLKRLMTIHPNIDFSEFDIISYMGLSKRHERVSFLNKYMNVHEIN